MITAGIDVDESVNDPVVVGLNWTYTPSGTVVKGLVNKYHTNDLT